MPSLRSWLGSLGTLALTALPAPAIAQKVGPEFQANTYTPGLQQDPSVASDTTGNFVVVWESHQEGGQYGIFGQRYDVAGRAQGGEFHVNTYTTWRQQDPSVASDASGNFAVVWASERQDGSDWGIFGQRYDGAGVAQGAEFRVNSYTPSYQHRPSVAAAADGKFVVVWESWTNDGSGRGIFGQRYDSDGVALGSEFRVNSYTTDAQEAPSVASDASGNFVVVWMSYKRDWGIFGQRYDSVGGMLGAEFRVDSYTSAAQLYPSVAAAADGGFVVVWESAGQDGDGRGVFGQRYDGDGMRLGAEFRVNSYTTSYQWHPSVASDASGNLVVVWQTEFADGSVGIFGQRYDGTGTAQGNEFQINSFTPNGATLPTVAAADTERFVVAWSAWHDGGASGVFGQRFNFGPDTIPPSITVATPDGGEQLLTGSSYQIGWAASDDTALSSFDASASVDGGNSFTPITECQRLPASAKSCVWLAPGPPSMNALVRVTARDMSGNSASDDSDAPLAIISGTGSVTVVSPNANVRWRIGSVQTIEWTHDLGPNSSFRIELDRYNDGGYEELIAAAAPATSATEGSLVWTVTGPASATARVRVAWTGSPAVSDSSDVTFSVGPAQIVSEFQINTYTTDHQATFSGRNLIAANAGGDFVVVWEGANQDGYGDGIFGQRYDSAGDTLGREFRVNSFTPFWQSQPSVAASGVLGWVVVWGSQHQDGSQYGVFGQRYDGAGEPLGSEFRVNSYTTENQKEPSIASDASGNFVVVWESRFQDGDGYGVFGQRFDSGGRALGGEFRVNSHTSRDQIIPSAASDAAGNFVVVWESDDRDGSGIFGQRYDRAGLAQGDEFRVNSYTTGTQSHPSVASDTSGNFVVVWHGSGEGEAYFGIFGQRYDSAGHVVGSEFQVNTFTTAYQWGPSVASDPTGNFVVTWASLTQDGSYGGVFGQRYDNAGVPEGDEFQVNTFTTRSQGSPSVGVTSTNQFVVAWTSYGQDGSGEGVFGRRFNFGPDTVPPTVTVVAPDGGEKLLTGSSYEIRWAASDDTALAGFDASASVDGGQSFTPIVECQRLPGSARSCLWIAPHPPSHNALIRIRARDTSGNSASDDSNSVFGIVSGSGAVSVVGPNANVKWRIGSQQQIQWTHNLGANAAFRIELDRYNDGVYEELIAAAAPAFAAAKGRFNWTVTGPPSAAARVRVSWSNNLAVSDSTDGTFQIRPPAFGEGE
jgi:hypothetical protein